MKRIYNIVLLLALSMAAAALPVNPRALEAALQAGDTARYEALLRHTQFVQQQAAEVVGRAHRQTTATAQASPLNIAPRGLIILVNFSDLSYQTDKAEMDSMINGINYSRNYQYTYAGQIYRYSSTGSARQYFQDVSYGQYNPQFDVIGPVTLSESYAYYGSNRGYYGGSDARAHEMVLEACEQAKQLGADFTQYDNDHDGEVDFVFIIYAGYGEADGAGDDYIWPHTSSVSWCDYRLDNKLIGSYACSNEINYYSHQHTGIGTFVHEFSHVLGLPDLYSTDHAEHKTMGCWDVMDAGPYNNDGNTPPSYSAYERFFMGWLTPNVIKEQGEYQLHELNESGEAYLLTMFGTHNLVGNDPSPSTFYILEHRAKSGWDKYLPGSGMLITKVKYSYSTWENNIVNNNANNQCVDLIEADGQYPTSQQSGYTGKTGDAFPSGTDHFHGMSNYPINAIVKSGNTLFGNLLVTFRVGNLPEGVHTIEAEPATAKFWKNGQIVIRQGTTIYDLQGNIIAIEE